MTGDSMVDLLLRSIVLIAASWAFAETIGRAGGSAAMRHATLLFGFAALALLPVLSVAVPALPLPVLPATPDVSTGMAAAPAVATPAATPSPASLLELLYCAVTLCLLGRLVAGRILLSRIWASARPVESSEHLRLLALLSESFGIRRRISLRIANGPAVPMTWGLLRPRILLPPDARTWSADRWRVVLLHELGHVARNDSSSRTAAAVLCAVYWLNPAAWFAAARMLREQEHACDDLVLSQGADAALYARNLLAAARAFRGNGYLLAAAIIGRSDLERRLVAIVGDVSRKGAGRLFVAAGAAVTLSAAGLAAAVVPVAATAPEPPPAPQIVPAPATMPAAAAVIPATEAVAPVARVVRTAPARHPVPAPAAIVVQAAAPVPPSAASRYQEQLARYREEKARYFEDLGIYRMKFGEYRAALAQHRRDLAEHRRITEAVRALPAGDPRKLVPPAPTAPVAPVAPVAPAVPPVPPDLHDS